MMIMWTNHDESVSFLIRQEKRRSLKNTISTKLLFMKPKMEVQ